MNFEKFDRREMKTMRSMKNNAVMKKLIGGVGALAVAFAASTAQAIPLSALLDTPAFFDVDDKRFSDWTLLGNNPGGPAIDTANIEVTGDPGDPLNPGILFTASNGALSAVNDDFLLLNFRFKVTVTDPTQRMIGNTLNLDASTVNGFGFISIEETVCTSPLCFPFSPDEIAFKNVFQDDFGGIFQDIQPFPSQTEIWVDKFLTIDGGGPAIFGGGEAAVLQFSQYFAQEEIVVDTPEPGTLALFALGLIGFGFSRRRARR